MYSFTVYFNAQPSVDIKTVLSRLMERLSNYAGSSVEVSKIRDFAELVQIKKNQFFLVIMPEILSCRFYLNFYK